MWINVTANLRISTIQWKFQDLIEDFVEQGDSVILKQAPIVCVPSFKQ